MDELANLLNFILLIIIVISVIQSLIQRSSYRKKENQAESKAANFVKEVEDSSSDLNSTSHFTTHDETTALQKVYSLTLDKPVKTITISGGIKITALLSHLQVTECFITIADIQVHFPKMAVSNSSYTLPEEGDAKVAVIDDALYLLEVEGFSLINYHEGEKAEEQATNAILSGKRGKIEHLPLEIIGQREASQAEREHFDPIIAGKRYAIPMILSFIALAFFLTELQSFAIWLGCYGAVLLIGFFLWRNKLKKERKNFSVTRLRGVFDEILINENGEYFLRIHDSNASSGELFCPLLPAWAESIPLDKEVSFEVRESDSYVVSIQHTHSFEGHSSSPFAYRKWVAITGVAMTLSLLFSLNLQQAKLSLAMLPFTFNQAEEISLSNLQSAQIGQRMHIPQTYKQCSINNIDSSESNIYDQVFCSQFSILEAPIKYNINELNASAIQQLQQLEESMAPLAFATISAIAYGRMNILASLSGQELTARRNIATVDYNTLHSWAVMIESDPQSKEYTKIREQLLTLWAEIKEVDDCNNECWDELLTKREEYAHALSYDLHSHLGKLNDYRQNKIHKETKSIITQWYQNALHITNQYKTHITMEIMDSTQSFYDLSDGESSWKKISKALTSGSRKPSMLILQLNTALKYLQDSQQGSVDGLIYSIEKTDEGTHFKLYTSMTTHSYYSNLAQIGLACLGLLIALLFILPKRASSRVKTI